MSMAGVTSICLYLSKDPEDLNGFGYVSGSPLTADSEFVSTSGAISKQKDA